MPLHLFTTEEQTKPIYSYRTENSGCPLNILKGTETKCPFLKPCWPPLSREVKGLDRRTGALWRHPLSGCREAEAACNPRKLVGRGTPVQPGSRQERVLPPLAGISATTRPPLSLSEPLAGGSRWETQVPGGKSS